MDLGNENDLCSCHHIRALCVVGCKAFEQCGRGRLAQMVERFSTARLMMVVKCLQMAEDIYWILDRHREIKWVQWLFYHPETGNTLVDELEVTFESLKIGCIYHSFCFPWSAENIQYLLKTALKMSWGLHISFYGFLFEKYRVAIYSCSTFEKTLDQTKLKGGDIPLTQPQNLLLWWSLGVPFLHETSSSAWPLLSSFPSYKLRDWQNFEAMTWSREREEIPFSRQKAKRTITGWYFFKWQESQSQGLPFEFCYKGPKWCLHQPDQRFWSPRKSIVITVSQDILRGIFPQKFSKIITCEFWFTKACENVNCTCMLSKALGLVFAWCVPTSSVVSCGDKLRICIRFPTNNLAETRRAGEFVLSSPGKCICVLEQQLALYVSMDLYLWK